MVVYHGSQLLVAVKVAATPVFAEATATKEFSFNFDRDLEEVYIHGDPAPQQLAAGHYAISGSITRDFETGVFSAAGVTFFEMATGMVGGVLTYHAAIFPEGDALPKFDVEDIKFNGYSQSAPLKGIVQETATFKGLLIVLT